MARGRKGGTTGGNAFAVKARACWGEKLPDWVLVLAEYADTHSGTRAAKAIGYSPAVVTHVIANAYPGDLDRVEGKVRGALMGATVACAVYGDISRGRCLDNQSLPFAATSSPRARCFHECRSGRCPHSRLVPFQGALKE